MYQLRQIRLALGKDRDKVDRLLISENKYDWEKFSDEFKGQKYIDPNINLLEVEDSFKNKTWIIPLKYD